MRPDQVHLTTRAKGRIERFFETAQDRLVKGLRKAGVNSRKGANEYLEGVYLPRWKERFTVRPANDSDAHRPLRREHNLAAILSHVEERVIRPDYTFPLGAKHYQIAKRAIVARMRGTRLRVEQRLDGSVAVCWEGRYVEIAPCAGRARAEAEAVRPAKGAVGRGERKVNRAWMEGFWERPAPPLWAAIRESNRTS